MNKKGTIYMLTLHISPCPTGRNLNKSFLPRYSRALTLQLTTRIILINNTNNLFQQHCAQNNTLGAQGDLLKTMVVNRVVNYRQFKEYILFELEECAWRIGNSKQNEEIDNNHKCQLIYKSLN